MIKTKEKTKSLRKSIMIIDDNESVRLLIGSYFEKDYDVKYMTDGHEALKYIRDGYNPDLILLDMEMPNMNGRIFLRRLRYTPVIKDIPVIFISSVNSRLIINSMIKLGITDYIVKPFKAEELIEKVNKVLTNENKDIGTVL